MDGHLTLLTLPLEIRELIYDLVLEPETFDFFDKTYMLSDERPSLMHNITAFNIVAVGTAPHREQAQLQSLSRQHNDPWVLARICRQIQNETARRLGAISLDNVYFSFYGFTPADLNEWVDRVGADAVSKIRRWGIDNVNWCQDWHHWAERQPQQWELSPDCLKLHRAPHREQIQCYRAISVDMVTSDAELIERNTLAQYYSQTNDDRIDFHYDHRTGYRGTAAHMHPERTDVGCNLELRQGCLDAEEQFMVKNGARGAGSARAAATVAGLKTLVRAVKGREQYDDERLLTKFPSVTSCQGAR